MKAIRWTYDIRPDTRTSNVRVGVWLFLASEALQVFANGVIVDLRPRSDLFIRFPLLLVPGTNGFQPSAARTSNSLRADWLFSYRPTPGTVFFAGYGASLSEPDPLAFDRLRRVGDSFFLKASYLLRAR